MELDTRPSEPEDPSYRISLIALAILIAAVVGLQFWGEHSLRASERDGANREAEIRAGDYSAKWDFAWNMGKMTELALKSYKNAEPWPAAYRRLGVFKEFHKQSGLPEFNKLDSPAATRHLSKKRIRNLHSQKQMWLRIYGPSKLSQEDARRYTKDIKALDMGPLKVIALAKVQERAGQPKKAARMLASAKSDAQLLLIAAMCIIGLLCLGGLGGIAIAVVFLVVSAPSLANAPKFQLRSSALLSAFIAYLAAYMWLSASSRVIGKIFGLGPPDTWSGAGYMGALIASAAGAFAFGIWVLIARITQVGQNWRKIGFRTSSAGRDILLGIAGFLASMPFVVIAALISLGLSKTIFKHFPTPEQPFGGIISEGGAVEIILVFLAASVVAPIVEETFFRGALYSAFRGKMGVWHSALLTSAIFAIIHPLPGGFLPIFAFACILAMLREKSGSLLPCMVCHCVYNTVGLILVTLLT